MPLQAGALEVGTGLPGQTQLHPLVRYMPRVQVVDLVLDMEQAPPLLPRGTAPALHRVVVIQATAHLVSKVGVLTLALRALNTAPISEIGSLAAFAPAGRI